MFKPIIFSVAMLGMFAGGAPLRAQNRAATPSISSARQTESDEYARYELLAPDTASFKILYEVTATTPGAKVFFNPIRKGSVASGEAVYDAMTGEPLKFEIVPVERDPASPMPGGVHLFANLYGPRLMGRIRHRVSYAEK